MDKEQALRLLEILAEDESIASEISEEKLFQQKQEILQKFMVPSLLQKKIVRLKEFASACTILGLEKESQVSIPQWENTPSDQIAFLEGYEQQLSALKLGLMNCKGFHELILWVQEMILTQEKFMVLFKQFFSDHHQALPEEVNTRELIDTGALLRYLKEPDSAKDMNWAIEKELARIKKIHHLQPTAVP